MAGLERIWSAIDADAASNADQLKPFQALRYNACHHRNPPFQSD